MEYIKTPTGQMNPDIRYTDDPYLLKLLDKQIGKWGTLWQQWIETTTNKKIDYVMGCTWAIVPRIVDEKAQKRYEELAETYDKTHDDRPHAFMEILRWEEERKLYIEHRIMEEIVQVIYPTEQPDYYNMTPINTDDE